MSPAAAGPIGTRSPGFSSRDATAEIAAPVEQNGSSGSVVAVTAPAFRLRCMDVLSNHCDASWRSPSLEEVVRLACAHGATAHGFTPVWYSPERMAAIRAAASFH